MTIKRFTETLRQRRLTLLGHIIRADQGDPMRRITFQPTVRLEEFDNGKKRVGNPRHKWIDMTMSDAWETIRAPRSVITYSGNYMQKQKNQNRRDEQGPPFSNEKH